MIILASFSIWMNIKRKLFFEMSLSLYFLFFVYMIDLWNNDDILDPLHIHPANTTVQNQGLNQTVLKVFVKCITFVLTCDINTQIWVKFSHQMFLSIHFLIFKTNPRFCIYYEILLLLSLTSRLSLSASLPALKCCYQSYHKFTFGLFSHFFQWDWWHVPFHFRPKLPWSTMLCIYLPKPCMI